MAPATPSGINLNSLSIFDEVEAGLVKSLLSSASVSHLDKGEILLRAEEPVLRFCLLLEGWACVRKGNAEGQESVLHILAPNDFFPEPNRENRNPYRANIEALCPVTVLSFPSPLIRDACERSPLFAANMLHLSSARTQQLLDHIEHLTLRDAEQRVGWFLLKLRDETHSDGQEINLPFEKSVIASYLGIKPETLSRVLQQLRQAGIGIKRNKISLPHPQALCGYCDAQIASECEHSDKSYCPFTQAQNRAVV